MARAVRSLGHRTQSKRQTDKAHRTRFQSQKVTNSKVALLLKLENREEKKQTFLSKKNRNTYTNYHKSHQGAMGRGGSPCWTGDSRHGLWSQATWVQVLALTLNLTLGNLSRGLLKGAHHWAHLLFSRLSVFTWCTLPQYTRVQEGPQDAAPPLQHLHRARLPQAHLQLRNPLHPVHGAGRPHLGLTALAHLRAQPWRGSRPTRSRTAWLSRLRSA